MSTGEGFARPKRRRLVDMTAPGQKNPDEQQRAYYDMLSARLEGLLEEIEQAGTSPDDDLVKRLRALYSEVSKPVVREKARED
ncbi:MAG: hypothetical protein KF769_05155 [Parvibaculum sp.]|uniref:hypothetical protein n=1 Tax=Parvibaculum sp. TaxID=2024848 RepID=UPI001D60C049|nr:hypothetical protein [Parvibaculum sp.]MBX3489335.1 hypothetical protein [Parvibaculum sp.]MBX3495612.1 hypothetical protein [Parvibaculum sp.]MCW5726709.1 hypothetical protein [Parvibaculum sp.]